MLEILESMCCLHDDNRYKKVKKDLIERYNKTEQQEKEKCKEKLDQEFRFQRIPTVKNFFDLCVLGSFLLETARRNGFQILEDQNSRIEGEKIACLLNQLFETAKPERHLSREIQYTARKFGDAILGLWFSKNPNNVQLEILLEDILERKLVQCRGMFPTEVVLEEHRSNSEDNSFLRTAFLGGNRAITVSDKTESSSPISKESFLQENKIKFNCFRSRLVYFLLEQIDYRIGQIQEKKQKITKKRSLLFKVNELKVSFISKLKKAEDLLSQHLKKEFSEELQQKIEEHNESKKVQKLLKNNIAQELNQLLKKTLYRKEFFHKVQLSEPTKALLSQNPQGDLIQLNRLLIQDAYPEDIVRKHRKTLKYYLRKHPVQPLVKRIVTFLFCVNPEIKNLLPEYQRQLFLKYQERLTSNKNIENRVKFRLEFEKCIRNIEEQIDSLQNELKVFVDLTEIYRERKYRLVFLEEVLLGIFWELDEFIRTIEYTIDEEKW